MIGVMMKPTSEAYDELQIAYDHFNEHLFNNALPQCLITLQREKRTYGYFSPERFVHSKGKRTDEIAMNPAYFSVCPPVEIMQTLVHEMVHLWQHHFGKTGRRGYHNKEWANKMESIGLMPSSTGKEGGAKTGDRMADYVIEGGRFISVYEKLMNNDFSISWMDRFPAQDKIFQIFEEAKDPQEFIEACESKGIDTQNIKVTDDGKITFLTQNKSNRIKYSCPTCEVNVWGKPELTILCGECSEPFISNKS